MEKVKCVFIILTYRTGQDIPGFVNSIPPEIRQNSRIIVVDSFFSEEAVASIKIIAEENGCDFLSVPNNGYGYGNNRGIEYANNHYDYEYAIVCNADIEIKQADFSLLSSEAVNAPMITTVNGKNQNPYFAVRNTFAEWLIYQGHVRQSRLFMILGQGMNKVIRELFLVLFRLSCRANSKIYAAHGSFLIFPRKVIDVIFPVFDEQMFLYYEEAYLANKLYKNKIDIVLHKAISILHYEDGSTKGSNIDLSPYSTKSYRYYYEKYRLR